MSVIMNDTINTILERRTVRAYKQRPLTGDELDTLLAAADWAPSARNAQQVFARIVDSKAILDEINAEFWKTVTPGAKPYSRCETNPFYQNAPTVFFLYSENESYTDTGILAQNIMLAAKSIGLGSCPIGSVCGFLNSDDGKSVKNLLKIPENDIITLLVAVGEPDEEPEKKDRRSGKFEVL